MNGWQGSGVSQINDGARLGLRCLEASAGQRKAFREAGFVGNVPEVSIRFPSTTRDLCFRLGYHGGGAFEIATRSKFCLLPGAVGLPAPAYCPSVPQPGQGKPSQHHSLISSFAVQLFSSSIPARQHQLAIASDKISTPRLSASALSPKLAAHAINHIQPRQGSTSTSLDHHPSSRGSDLATWSLT